MKKYFYHGCVLAAGIMWGLIGIFNRNLMDAGLGVGGIVFIRNVGSLVVLGLLFLLTDRSVFKIRLRHLPYFLGTGIISVLLFTLCYFSCQKLCSLAVAAVLLYTAPAFVVILSAVLWKDKITKSKLIALLLAFLGCTLVTGLWSGDLTMTAWGAVMGIASGFFYALYSIFGHYALKYYKPFTMTFYTFAVAGVGALFVVKPAELAATLSQPGMIWMALGLVIISTVGPYLCYTKGLAGLDSSKAAILASIEPVTAALVGVLAFGEPMSVAVILGLLCILGSVYILR